MTELFYGILSIVITIILIVIVKIVDYVKFRGLVGSYKAVVVISSLIILAETIYLTISFRFLTYALETVTSLSALLIFLAFVFLNKLQNAASGLSIALSTKINVGDKIEISGKKGIIVQLGLTKTIIELDDSNSKLYLPNKKFDEEAVVIPTKQKNQWSKI